MNRKQAVIFCDFDGTITEQDNIVAIMNHFHPPGWESIVQQIITRQITIQQGVGHLFSLLPSTNQQEIVRFTLENIQIRRGFPELLTFARENNIRFLVTSGGIDFFIHPTLQPFGLSPGDIYCNESDFSGSAVRILWPHACDPECSSGGCGMCKTTIIRAYPEDQYLRILIGDSVTDFEGAKIADVVFARSHLIERCQELEVPYYPFEDFFDVQSALQLILKEASITP